MPSSPWMYLRRSLITSYICRNYNRKPTDTGFIVFVDVCAFPFVSITEFLEFQIRKVEQMWSKDKKFSCLLMNQGASLITVEAERGGGRGYELISRGGKVSAAILPYEEASNLCGGSLPANIPKDKLGDNPGFPCGGTHVSDISDIISMKATQFRTEKGMTKVFYTIGS